MMRIFALLCCTLLLGCQLSPDPAEDAGPTAEDDLTAAHQAELELPEPEPTDDPPKVDPPSEPEPEVLEVPPKPALPAALQPVAAQCEKDGGRLVPRESSGLFSCVKPTRDSGKMCSDAGDCQGVCLARSRTCAPADPLLGCHEVLGRNGARSTVCLQ